VQGAGWTDRSADAWNGDNATGALLVRLAFGQRDFDASLAPFYPVEVNADEL
jgi:hypothetical protein